MASLGNTAVTDAGVKQLVGLKKLRHVNLPGTKVTDDGRQSLKEAIPEIVVQ
jgi:hypothetical protein